MEDRAAGVYIRVMSARLRAAHSKGEKPWRPASCLRASPTKESARP